MYFTEANRDERILHLPSSRQNDFYDNRNDGKISFY